MKTITFAEIHERVARHHAEEAARHAPKPTAIRAVYTLASALADLGDADRRDVLALLVDEVLAAPANDLAALSVLEA